MIQAEMLKNMSINGDLLKHFRKLHVIDKNNNRIKFQEVDGYGNDKKRRACKRANY